MASFAEPTTATSTSSTQRIVPLDYRRLPDVLAAQSETVQVLHTLRPLIVVMAGPNEFDPYKD